MTAHDKALLATVRNGRFEVQKGQLNLMVPVAGLTVQKVAGIFTDGKQHNYVMPIITVAWIGISNQPVHTPIHHSLS